MEYVDNEFYEQFGESIEQDAALLEELARHQPRDFRIVDDAGFADE